MAVFCVISTAGGSYPVSHDICHNQVFSPRLISLPFLFPLVSCSECFCHSSTWQRRRNSRTALCEGRYEICTYFQSFHMGFSDQARPLEPSSLNHVLTEFLGMYVQHVLRVITCCLLMTHVVCHAQSRVFTSSSVANINVT